MLAYLYLRTKQKNHTNLKIVILLILAMSVLELVAVREGMYLLGVCVFIPALYIIEKKFPDLYTKIKDPRGGVLIFAFALIFINGAFFTLELIQGKYYWLAQITDPPRNGLLVDKGIQWVSAELSKAGSNCVFDLSNNGVINGVTALPACTKYTYPVYATQRYEGDMIQELQQRNPPIIVFYSTYWPFSIDGKSMHDRFPELKNYLLKTYQYEKCNFGYCLRYIKKPS